MNTNVKCNCILFLNFFSLSLSFCKNKALFTRPSPMIMTVDLSGARPEVYRRSWHGSGAQLCASAQCLQKHSKHRKWQSSLSFITSLSPGEKSQWKALFSSVTQQRTNDTALQAVSPFALPVLYCVQIMSPYGDPKHPDIYSALHYWWTKTFLHRNQCNKLGSLLSLVQIWENNVSCNIIFMSPLLWIYLENLWIHYCYSLLMLLSG